ncbi:permease component of ABC-type sugar transporter [Halobacteroides halobius DSM 5150]|uniref:Permease component of ABC-type sugar transporter n=1 Tax=Halobacteroides halobius (strain ATCC 35273 / DSM 5150 / MD-1) TaxID=748449 RepID=L0KCE9_HALHC|nr:sugar ABC transporter permease [Halobacteroides halobius]AGB41748.1 permease component of ABC-type sugar transporter [Halobacteroides halobius DSM 5150]
MVRTKVTQLTFDLFRKVTGKEISRKKFEDWLAGYLFILAPILVIGVFKLIPTFYAFFLSFQKWDLLTKPEFVGLKNYANLLDDKILAIAIKNTLFYTAFVVPIQMVLALVLALLVNQSVKFRTFFRASFFMPAVTASVVLSVIFLALYSKIGLFNQILATLGLGTYDFMGNKSLALPSIMAMNIWSTAGYFMIVYLAGLQEIPEQLYESAEVDGASNWQKLWHITIPMLKPTSFFIAVMSVIGCLQIFDQVVVMTGNGGPVHATTTMVFYIYRNAFKYFKMGYASAASFLLFVIIFTLTLIQKKYFDDTSY